MKIIFIFVTWCQGNEISLVSTAQMLSVSARGEWNVCLTVTATEIKISVFLLFLTVVCVFGAIVGVLLTYPGAPNSTWTLKPHFKNV